MKKRIYVCFAILLFISMLLIGCEKGPTDCVTEVTELENTEEESKVRLTFSEEEMLSEENTKNAAYVPTEENTQIDAYPPQKDSTPSPENTDDTFDYVALGNSVTCNRIDGELWWGNWGMAATSPQKDYIHLVASWLGEQLEPRVSTTVLDLKDWEVSQNRDKILKDYTDYFDENTDLVTIQTGENITEFKDTLKSDYSNFLKLIREKAPNAQILVLGEVLWPAEDIEAAKKAACKEHGVTFVEMTKFLKNYESSYRAEMGTKVEGSDGKKHKITNEVVAAHPNNKGMACIAELIIEEIILE